MKKNFLIILTLSIFYCSTGLAHLSDALITAYFERIKEGQIRNLYNELYRAGASAEDLDILESLVINEIVAQNLAILQPRNYQVRMRRLREAQQVIDRLREDLEHRVPQPQRPRAGSDAIVPDYLPPTRIRHHEYHRAQQPQRHRRHRERHGAHMPPPAPPSSPMS